MKFALFVVGLALASATNRPLIHLLPTVDSRQGFVHFQRGDSKIVGGEEAIPHEFPWQVALRIDEVYFCGGSLISMDRVLTAGHCTIDAGEIIVIAGAHDQSIPESTQQSLTSTDIVTHENYRSLFLRNDIGLVKLPSKFISTDNIKAITLPASTDDRLGAGETVTVSGWGKTDDGFLTGVSDTLHKTDDVTVSNADCSKTYGNVTIDEGTICTATSGIQNHGTCNGDSGGPMMWTDSNGIVIHRGITSFVSSSGCQAGLPDGFTRTWYYLQWISDNYGV